MGAIFSGLALQGYTPLRRRVQEFVDRRFYRRKYDAERTLEAFNASLREHVELEQLTRKLTEVVAEALQPEKLSIWLRPIEKRQIESRS